MTTTTATTLPSGGERLGGNSASESSRNAPTLPSQAGRSDGACTMPAARTPLTVRQRGSPAAIAQATLSRPGACRPGRSRPGRRGAGRGRCRRAGRQ